MDVDRRGYLVELQSVRGIASMIVVLGHSSTKFGGPDWWLKATSFFNGDAAVGMFFVLSGFVLTKMLSPRAITLDFGIEFLIRRLFRIYPTLLVATAASLVFLLVYHHLRPLIDSDWLSHEFTDSRQSLPFIILAFLGASAHLVPQAWTISIELLGSLLMPIIAWLAFNRVRQLGTILIFAIVVGMTVGPYTPYAVPMFIPHFIVGSLIYVMPARLGDFLRNLPARQTAVVLATVIMIGLRSSVEPQLFNPYFAFEELVCSAFIVAMLVHGGVSFRILRATPVEWLGDISYSLYMFHFVVIFFGIVGFCLIETASGITLPPVLNNLLLMLVVVGVSLPISAVAYRLIERPGNDFGKNLSRRLPRARIRNMARRLGVN